jgi:hypothetical protein
MIDYQIERHGTGSLYCITLWPAQWTVAMQWPGKRALILFHQESRCTEKLNIVKFRAPLGESGLHKKGQTADFSLCVYSALAQYVWDYCQAQLEVVHFSKNNFSKNSKNDIQFFEKFRKISKKIEKISTSHFVLFKPLFLVQTSIIALYMYEYFNEVLNFQCWISKLSEKKSKTFWAMHGKATMHMESNFGLLLCPKSIKNGQIGLD